jgi:hypothetical protein
MSADGSYVFFEDTDGLTPQALNDKPIGERHGRVVYAHNIYEYHDGDVHLISDGADISQGGDYSSPVHLLGTDPTGDDVFFSTLSQLVPQDTDSDIDVYDARVNGGFPTPLETPECTSDGCQGPLSAAPTLLSPGSEFQAGANPPLAVAAPVAKAKAKAKAKKCKQGTTLKHGKCTKTKGKRKIGAKKSNQRRGK